MKFIITVIGLLILLLIIGKITNIIFSVKKEKVSESAGNHIDRWGRWILGILAGIMILFSGGSSDMQRMFYLLIFFALLFGYHAMMEFLFVKESRQYITTTVLFLTILISMYVLYQFPILQN